MVLTYVAIWLSNLYDNVHYTILLFHFQLWFSSLKMLSLQKLLCPKGFCVKSKDIKEEAYGSWACNAFTLSISCHIHAGISLSEAC